MARKAFYIGAMLGLVVISVFYANIIFHELGHFFVAKHYGLEPRLYLFDNGMGTGFSFTNQNFYVTYNKVSENKIIDGLIALAGPLVNAIFALAFGIAYCFVPKKRKLVRLCLKMCFIISALSAAVNFLPINESDGEKILTAFF